MQQNIFELAKILWGYHHMNHKIEKSDLIFVLGSRDPRAANRGAELLKQGFGKRILFSGGLGRFTKHSSEFTGTTEAEKFAKIAKNLGIPDTDIILETKSSNTAENIKYSYELIKNMNIKKIILVSRPYLERRVYATFLKQRPGEKIDFCVTSPQISFENYPDEKIISIEVLVDVMVGELQRIIEYGKNGFQEYQEIPKEVMSAFDNLIQLGFTKNLIN